LLCAFYSSAYTIGQKIIEQYQGEMPLAAYLKNYFAAHNKFGSKDRKQISNLCFSYYRLGNAIGNIPFEKRILIALFLCNDAIKTEWNSLFTDEWKANWDKDLRQRISFVQTLYNHFNSANILSFSDELSAGIDADTFSESHLIQPDLFLRIRPGKEKVVIDKLSEANIAFNQLTDTCIAVPNATKIDDIIKIDEEAVVQDYSSQQIAIFLDSARNKTVNPSTPLRIYDCCAASGGKSILAKDVLGNIDITVSDIRPSILQNLQTRFAKAGIKKYHSFVADLSEVKSEKSKPKNNFTFHLPLFNLIICDAPCSGSGTWGRTPEQLHYFKKEKISYYAGLQKQIVSNAIKQLQDNGYFLYITCSVLSKRMKK